jgi:hypothetical protein
MKHFDETAWADFARNVMTPATKMTMQQHLDQGCKPCAAALKTWQSVHVVAQAESALTPPADVVRVVKSQFAAVTPEKNLGVRLLFDSGLAPLAAGVRGSVAARQFLYETDEYYIDLRVEPQHQTSQHHTSQHNAAVVGQVLHRAGKDRAAQGVTVFLQEGGRSIAETSTNQFGEFQLEFDQAQRLSLSVRQGKADDIVLPLYGIDATSTDGKRGN